MAKIPTKIIARISYWESKGLPKMVSTKTKTYKETVHKLTQLVEGTGIFGGTNYTMPDFRLSVDRHASKVFDPHFFPSNKKNIKRITLNNFLYSPFAAGVYPSAFIRNVEYPPIPVRIKTDNASLFLTLTDLYLKESNNGIKTIDDLSPLNQRDLAETANRIANYYKNRKQKMDRYGVPSQKRLAALLITAARSFTKYDSEKFCTGLLTRQWVWEKFPNYLHKNGFLAPQKTFNINQC